MAAPRTEDVAEAIAGDDEYVRTTRVLAEHLGYAPMDAVDDVINAINDIMYASTEQVERALGGGEEVQRGTAQLESYLEHVINRNFDRFELYAFRNVFAVPNELLDAGCVQLEGYRGIYEGEDPQGRCSALRAEQLALVEAIQAEIARAEELRASIETLEPLAHRCQAVRHAMAPLDTASVRDTVVFAKNALGAHVH